MRNLIVLLTLILCSCTVSNTITDKEYYGYVNRVSLSTTLNGRSCKYIVHVHRPRPTFKTYKIYTDREYKVGQRVIIYRDNIKTNFYEKK